MSEGRTKSQEEYLALQKVQRLAEGALEKLEPMLRPGMTERAAAALLREQCEAIPGVSRVLTDMVLCGPDSASFHSFAGDRAIGVGELILIDFSVVVDGWYSDMTRMYALGEPEPEAKAICVTVEEAKAAALSAVRPGIPCAKLHAAAAAVIEAAGYGGCFPHGVGHGVGHEMHEAPRLAPESGDILAVGDVFSIEPGIYLPGRFGARLEDLYYLSEAGALRLNQRPCTLKVLSI